MSTQQRTRLSTKKLEVYLKQNITGEEIAQRLGFDSLLDLDSAMEKTFSSSAYNYYHGRLSKKTAKKVVAKKKSAAESEPKPAFVEEEQVSRPTLDELRQQEKEQQLVTVEREVAVKAVRQRARENLQAIHDLKEKIDGWKKMIDEGLSEIDTLEDEAINILADHEEALNALHKEQEKLQNIRDQIEDRTVIFVLVGAGNDYETEIDGSPIELTFGEWESLYQEIISLGTEMLESLTIGQIIMVAKMLTLPNDQEYDITFELGEAQKLYSHMKSKLSH